MFYSREGAVENLSHSGELKYEPNEIEGQSHGDG